MKISKSKGPHKQKFKYFVVILFGKEEISAKTLKTY